LARRERWRQVGHHAIAHRIARYAKWAAIFVNAETHIHGLVCIAAAPDKVRHGRLNARNIEQIIAATA
jgi:hypothetical protein